MDDPSQDSLTLLSLLSDSYIFTSDEGSKIIHGLYCRTSITAS